MNSMLFYTTSLGPPVGDPTAMYAPPLRYKREALAVHRGLSRDTQALANSLSREGNTTHSGRRVLRSGGPNHSNPAVFIVFLSEIELGLANPRVHTLWAGAGAFRHPAVVCSTTTFGAPGRGSIAGRSSSFLRPHESCGRCRDDGGCGVLHATRLSRSCSRGNCACGAATTGGGARCSPARVRAPIKGPLTGCERRSAGSG